MRGELGRLAPDRDGVARVNLAVDTVAARPSTPSRRGGRRKAPKAKASARRGPESQVYFSSKEASWYAEYDLSSYLCASI